VEIEAVDKNGKKISKLNNGISVTMPTLNKDKKNSKNSCVGYQHEKKSPYKCDNKNAKVMIDNLTF